MATTTVHTIDPNLTCLCDFANEAEAVKLAQDLVTELGVVEVRHSILGWEVWV
jgi:hypothetical protein